MARKSSRKSSSGDEALLWGIAAVVVAIVGVGTAIMLTRGKSACADVQCSSNQVKTGKTTWKTSKSECCKSSSSRPAKPAPNLGLTCGTAADGAAANYPCADYGKLKKNPTNIKCGTVCTKEMCCDKPGSGGHHGSGPKKPAAKKPAAKKPAAKKPAPKKLAAKCCGDGCASYSDKESCNGKGKYSNPLCYWDGTGQCKKEPYRDDERSSPCGAVGNPVCENGGNCFFPKQCVSIGRTGAMCACV